MIDYLPIPTIACGAVVTGEISDTSPLSWFRPEAWGCHARHYTYQALKGQHLVITLHSDDFDAFLYLARGTVGAGPRVVQSNDNDPNDPDSGWQGTTDSRLEYTVPNDGVYTIEVTASPYDYYGLGNYTLTVESCAQDTSLTPPLAPSDLAALGVTHPQPTGPDAVDEIDTRWADNSSNESGFELWRKMDTATGSGTWTLLTTLAANVVHYEDKNLAADAQYTYKVRAVRSVANSAPLYSDYSNEAGTNTYQIPPVISLMTPTANAVLGQTSAVLGFAASASNGASISHVEVFINAQSVGQAVWNVQAKQYVFSWTPSQIGTYYIEADVTDSHSLVGASTPVLVSVAANPAYPSVPTPVITPSGGSFDGPPVVTITDASPSATFYYTLYWYDASGSHTTEPKKYVGPFAATLPANQTGYVYLSATAYQADMSPSSASANYTITQGQSGGGGNTGVLTLGVYPRPDSVYPMLPVVTDAVSIYGAVGGPTVAYWELAYREMDGEQELPNYEVVSTGEWVNLQGGIQTPADGLLATFDPTMLANGLYQMRLRVYDTAGKFVDTFRTLQVKGGSKVGPFTMSLTDLSVPAPGFPIQITRTYNSLEKNKVTRIITVNGVEKKIRGDFGRGWSLGVSNIRVEKSRTSADSAPESLAIGRGWKSNGIFLSDAKDRPHVITVTVPSGMVYGFYVTLEGDDQGANVVYKPLPGTTATLTPNDGNPYPFVYADADEDAPSGEKALYDYDYGYLYDCSQFVLKTRDGNVYYIDTQNGLEMAQDPNGNKLRVLRDLQSGSDSIELTPGGSVTPTRRITIQRYNGYISSITDAAGKTLGYQQNDAGDLVTFTDRVVGGGNGNFGGQGGPAASYQTHYDYDFDHNLIAIHDPRDPTGAKVMVRNHYDKDGRLVSTEDANHKAATYSHFPSQHREVITDRAGNQTFMVYDAYGNVQRTTGYLKQADGTTKTVTSDAAYGFSVGDEMNPDKKVAEADPLGNVSRYAYSDKGDLTAMQGPRPFPVAGNTGSQAVGMKTRYFYDEPDHNPNSDIRGKVTRVEALDGLTPDGNGGWTETWRTLTENFYDAKGNLIKTLDAEHKATVYSDPNDPNSGYNADGTPKQVKDTAGHVTKYEYFSPANPQTGQADPRAGMVKAVTDADGHTTHFDYDANGNKLSQSTDRINAQTGQSETLTTTYSYDANGRMLTSKTPEGTQSATEYNEIGQASARKTLISGDPANNAAVYRTTTYHYNDQGQLDETHFSDGQMSRSEYDANGRAYKSIDKAGRVTQSEYDTLGRTIKTTTWDANGQNPAVSTTEYDDAGRVLSQTDALGRTTRSEYDEAGNLIKSWDALNHLTQYGYDKRNQQVMVVSPRPVPGSATQFLTTTMEYDEAGRVIKTHMPNGGLSETVYDTLGRRVAQKQTVHANANQPNQTRVTEYGYDDVGRLVQVTQIANPDGYQYPAPANPANLVTTYGYDAVGNKIRQTDALGHTTTFAYDKNGRMVKRTLPKGQSETMAYNADGTLQSKTDFRGKTTTFAYYGQFLPNSSTPDPRWGKLQSKTPDAGLNEPGITYDYWTSGPGVGQKKTQTYGGVTSAYEYDARGRLFQKTTTRTTGASSAVVDTLTYSYDLLGNRKSVQTQSGGTSGTGTTFTTTYDFDTLDRMAVVHHAGGGLTTYTYDEVGNRKTETGPNGITTTYTYDAGNYLTRLARTNGQGQAMSGASGSYTYGVDLSGKRTGVTDGAGQLTAYDYDAFGRLIAETVGTTKKTAYEYDNVGNRKRLLTSQPANAPPTSAATTTYAYDENDRLTGKQGPDGTFTYGYDASGNLMQTLGPSGRTDLVYTFENRLSEQTLTVGSSMHWANQTAYDYDAGGNRIGLERSIYDAANGTTTSQNTSYLVDENLPYAEVLEEREVQTSSNTVHLRLVSRYDMGQDRLEMDRFAYPNGTSEPTVGRFFYLRDGLGSTVALTDGSGSVTDGWNYDAYGTPSLNAGSAGTVNAFLFNGQQWDGGEGLYFLRARYYGPSTGRFLGQDPLLGDDEEPGTLHRYLYVGDDPIQFVDPSGEDGELVGTGTATSIAATQMGVVSPAIIAQINGIGAGAGATASISGPIPAIATLLAIVSGVIKQIEDDDDGFPFLILHKSGYPQYGMDKNKTYPTIVNANIAVALYRRRPALLTYDNASLQVQRARRKQAMRANGVSSDRTTLSIIDETGSTKIARPEWRSGIPGSWDEYPFASTEEGGSGSYVSLVPLEENNNQGTDMKSFYKYLREWYLLKKKQPNPPYKFGVIILPD